MAASRWRIARVLLFSGLASTAAALGCQGRDPDANAIVYRIRFPAPEAQVAEIEVSVPTEGESELILLMPVWSPGYPDSDP